MKKLITVFLLTCIIASLTVPVFAAGGVSAANWMAGIDGDLTLAQFTIPGTHDSCTQHCVFGRCQRTGIKEQLNMGVRFLDVRLKNDNGNFKCYHGIVYCFCSFQQVMEEASAFLKAHPSETIIMSVQNEGERSADFESAFVSRWLDSAQYKDLFFTENRIPKLDEVRGKIVLFRRYRNYSSDLARGIDASRNWKDDATFRISRVNYDLYIQDIYSYNSIGLIFGKKEFNNVKAFDESIAVNDPFNSPTAMSINFASGCDLIGAGQLSCATVVNSNLKKYFSTLRGHHGTVGVDYAESDLIKTLYETNFR